VTWSDILGGSVESRWTGSESAWSELLLLPVNAPWLARAVRGASDARLTGPARCWALGGRVAALSHVLLLLLVAELRRPLGAGAGPASSAFMRRRHALETLGVFSVGLLERPSIDFKSQILALFCPMESAEAFFADLLSALVGLALFSLPGVDGEAPAAGTLAGAPPGAASVAASALAADARKARAAEVEAHAYLRSLALRLLLALATGAENLQRNSLLDHFCVQHAAVERLLESALAGGDSGGAGGGGSGGWSLEDLEVCSALLALLCNHRKHETRSPFRAFVKTTGGTNVAFAVLFSLRDELAALNRALGAACQGSTLSLMDLAGVLNLVETASDGLVAWGSNIGSAFGAWVAGASSSAAAVAAASNNAHARSGGAGADHPRLDHAGGNRAAGGGSHHVPPPTLVAGDAATGVSSDGVPGAGGPMDALLWWRARVLLLVAYELLCAPTGEAWMLVLAEHDVPRWAGVGASAVACPQLLIEVLSTATFALHSGDPRVAMLGLTLVRCLAENVHVAALLFVERLEEAANVNGAMVFERKGANRSGAMAYVHHASGEAQQQQQQLLQQQQQQQQQHQPHQLVQRGSGRSVVTKTLAATCLRQLACVLIEYCGDVPVPATPYSTTTATAIAGAAQAAATATETASTGSGSAPPSPSNLNAPVGGAHAESRGALLWLAIEAMHRLLLYRTRARAAGDTLSSKGVEWRLVGKGLMDLLSLLARGGPGVVTDLRASRGAGGFSSLTAQTVHCANLALALAQQEGAPGLFYEVLAQRQVPLLLAVALEQLGEPAALKVAQHELGNLRSAVLHFAEAQAIMEQLQPASAPTGSAPAPGPAVAKALQAIAQALPQLKLRASDRLRDGFQRFAETAPERQLLRDLLGPLVGDARSLRLFERAVKKK
jgi:hypothetical protein